MHAQTHAFSCVVYHKNVLRVAKQDSHLNTCFCIFLLQVKPLKELTFNSRNITATMTSRQFQVMLDVLTNLLFARLPK